MKLWQATLKISRPGTSKTDEDMSAALVEREHMSNDAARVVKNLYGDHLKAVSSAERKAREDYKRLTLEGIGGMRVLVVDERQLYLDTMSKHQGVLIPLAEAFCDNYDLIIEQERLDKNGSFKPEDYPTRASIRSKFGFAFAIFPMPEPNQFLADAFTDDLGNKLAAVTEQVRRTVLNTMLNLVTDTAESLASDGPIIDSENKKGPFAKLQSYLDRIPALNVTDDPQITALYNQCRTSFSMSSDRLRASTTTRQLAAARAANIALKFGSGSRKLDLKPAATAEATATDPELVAA